MALIAPSLLSANFLNLDADCKMLNESEADWYHLDVMDGRFVPNISFGPMLVEFFLIHATGFFTAIANQPRSDRRLRIVGVLGLSLFYLLMIGAFAWTFGEWWPLLAFGWLAVGKLFWILRSAPAC